METKQNLEQERLKTAYREELKEVTMPHAGIKTIPQYLGQLMGEYEWSKSCDKANKKFIDVDAYDLFKREDYIVLVGRTGTGKSSILKKLEFEVLNAINNEYKDVVFINMSELIEQLTTYGSIDGTEKSYAEIRNYIEKFIKLTIIKHIVFTTKKDYSEYDISIFEKYLKNIDVEKNTSLGGLIGTFSEKINNETASDILNVIGLLSSISSKIFAVDFNKCEELLCEIFNKKKMLVLIDPCERYDSNDPATIVIINSILTVAFNCFANNKFLCVKTAMPSELYSILREQIPAKQIGNTVFIEWKYRDLVKFISTRCYILLTDSEWSQYFNIQYNEDYYNNVLKDYYCAKKFLLTFLPRKSEATINLCFDTLSYIIRHTQKKPRQLMIIFEAILHEIIKRKNIMFYYEDKTRLKQYVHSVQDSIISDSLNVYSFTHKNISDLTAQVLSKKKHIITAAQLNEFISKTSFGKSGMSQDLLKRILIESGIIGTVNESEIHYIAPDSTWFENPNVSKIVPAVFEYQIKGRLINNDESVFVVHPMCYEYYNLTIDCNCLVYPENSDDTDETFAYIYGLQ